jgi:hypothetical protein
MIGGYAIEGHVPARAIERLLRDRPAAVHQWYEGKKA